MKNLLADLDQNAGKKPWRTYTIKHGFEAIEVLIPLKNTAVFEAQIIKTKLPSRQAVLQFVNEHGGELKSKRT